MSRSAPSAPIRVAIVAPYPPPFGGIVRLMENHLKHWDPAQVEAYYVPVYAPSEPEPLEGAEFRDLAASTQRSHNGLASYLGFYATAPVTRPWVYRRLWRYNGALSRLVRGRSLDVIFSHQVWPAGAIAVLQARIHPGLAAVAATYGETWHATPEHARWARVEPYVLKGAHRLISSSDHCRAGALLRGGDPERHEVVYAGIDLERFHPRVDGRGFRATLGIPDDAFVISSLGLTLRRKLDTLLDALEAMRTTEGSPEVHCLIGGAGRDADYIARRVASMQGIRVNQLGFVDEEELPAFYAATDALVVSPNTLIECMGQSMKEAMACGRAVVGADIGGIPEAIENGRSGLLYKADNPRDLARTLEALVRDREACTRFGAEARRAAEAKFDAAVSAEKTLRILRDAVRTAREGLTS
jgi:glycosyltransferase involved in cell wall biosynthesis